MKVFEYTHGNSGWYDNYSGFYFIHTYPSEDGKTLISQNSTNTCREYFTMYFGNYIRNKNDLATNKAYALITTAYPKTMTLAGANWLDKVKNSMVILNAFEKHYGIPLTRIYPVKTKNFAGITFVVGSKRWTQSRYSFGLWTLFFRIGTIMPFSTASFKKLLPNMKWPEFYDRVMSSTYSSSQMTQMKAVFPKADAFFEFERKYLKNRYENWDNNWINNGMQRPEGINKLVTGYSYAPTVKIWWKEFYDVWKKKQKAKAV